LEEKLLHHGLCLGEFRPRYIGTDYFVFFHEPCFSIADITAVLVDNQGRIIFNVKCRNCGKKDVLKTHPYIFRKIPKNGVENIFYFSPKWKKRCQEHWWDNL